MRELKIMLEWEHSEPEGLRNRMVHSASGNILFGTVREPE